MDEEIKKLLNEHMERTSLLQKHALDELQKVSSFGNKVVALNAMYSAMRNKDPAHITELLQGLDVPQFLKGSEMAKPDEAPGKEKKRLSDIQCKLTITSRSLHDGGALYQVSDYLEVDGTWMRMIGVSIDASKLANDLGLKNAIADARGRFKIDSLPYEFVGTPREVNALWRQILKDVGDSVVNSIAERIDANEEV